MNYLKRLRLYLDSSVISHLDAPDRPDWMTDTLKLWKNIQNGEYDVVLSDIVFDEIEQCAEPKASYLSAMLKKIQYKRVASDDNTVALASRFVDFGIIGEKHFNDRRHIAAALLAGCDIIASWNFSHIVNANTIKGTKIITTVEGFKDIIICSPNMLTKGADDDE